MKIFFVVVFCLVIAEVNSQQFNLNKPIVELEKDYINYYQKEKDINAIAESFILLFQSGKAKDYLFPNLTKSLENNFKNGLTVIKSSDNLLTIYSFYIGGTMSSSVDIIVYRSGNTIISQKRMKTDDGANTIINRLIKIEDIPNPIYLALSSGSISNSSRWINTGTMVIIGNRIEEDKIPFVINGNTFFGYHFDASYQQKGSLDYTSFESILGYNNQDKSFYIPEVIVNKSSDFPQWTGGKIKVQYKNGKFYAINNEHKPTTDNAILFLEDLLRFNSHTDLSQKYRAEVKKDKWSTEGGDEEYISILYPYNNKRKVHLFWENDEYTNLKYIEVNIENTETDPDLETGWNTKEGLKTGLSLERLIQLNKRPVIFNQFEIDSREAGLITNYSNGLFENMAIDINLTPTNLKSYDNILKLQLETYNSDMPLIKQAKCVIRQIRIYPPSKQSVSKSIHDLCTNNRYKENDILSIRTESNVYTGIYSKINENSSKKSLKQTGNSRGLYRISKIDDILFDGHFRTFLICTPVSFQTNSLEVSDLIYVDYYKAVEASEIIFLTPGLNTAFDYSLIAYNYVPQTNVEKSNFQKEYLSMIFGESDLSKMDEFQINRLLSSSKQFLDSIYNSISKYFNLKRSSVFKLEISDYDFTQECFFINLLSKDKEFTLRENRLPKYCITNGQPLYQKGFINLFQFDGVLKFNPDEAEKFLNIIKNNGMEGEYNKRNVLAVGYYHWISEESAKLFTEKYNVNSSEYKYQKILDSLLIFPNSDITKPWKILLPKDIKSVSTEVLIDFPASFPGGDSKWRQFLERNLDANVPLRNGAPKGLYTVLIEFQVDSWGSASEYKPLTNHGYGMEDEAIRVIKKGPNWSPAVADGRQVKSTHKQAVLFTVQ